jgi:hypothetical protein
MQREKFALVMKRVGLGPRWNAAIVWNGGTVRIRHRRIPSQMVSDIVLDVADRCAHRPHLSALADLLFRVG